MPHLQYLAQKNLETDQTLKNGPSDMNLTNKKVSQFNSDPVQNEETPKQSRNERITKYSHTALLTKEDENVTDTEPMATNKSQQIMNFNNFLKSPQYGEQEDEINLLLCEENVGDMSKVNDIVGNTFVSPDKIIKNRAYQDTSGGGNENVRTSYCKEK